MLKIIFMLMMVLGISMKLNAQRYAIIALHTTGMATGNVSINKMYDDVIQSHAFLDLVYTSGWPDIKTYRWVVDSNGSYKLYFLRDSNIYLIKKGSIGEAVMHRLVLNNTGMYQVLSDEDSESGSSLLLKMQQGIFGIVMINGSLYKALCDKEDRYADIQLIFKTFCEIKQ